MLKTLEKDSSYLSLPRTVLRIQHLHRPILTEHILYCNRWTWSLLKRSFQFSRSAIMHRTLTVRKFSERTYICIMSYHVTVIREKNGGVRDRRNPIGPQGTPPCGRQHCHPRFPRARKQVWVHSPHTRTPPILHAFHPLINMCLAQFPQTLLPSLARAT